MRKVHSHYENLKVARNAPQEVIRAAYKALARLHHPDVNASDDSDRIMALINVAFSVLSDPEKRSEHDKWIVEQEGVLSSLPAQHRSTMQNSRGEPPSPANHESKVRAQGSYQEHPHSNAIWIAAAISIPVILLGLVAGFGGKPEEAPAPAPAPALTPAPVSKTFVNIESESQLTHERKVAELLRRNPPSPISVPGGDLWFTGAISPNVGEIRIQLRAKPKGRREVLEGSASRAGRLARARFCGPAGLIAELGLELSRTTLSIYENSVPIGDVILPTDFCS